MFQGYLLEFCWGIIFQVGNRIKLMFFKGNICSGFRSNGCWLRSNLSFSWICLKLSSSEIHSTDTLFCTPGLLFSGTNCGVLRPIRQSFWIRWFSKNQRFGGIFVPCSFNMCDVPQSQDASLNKWRWYLVWIFWGDFFFYGFKNPMANTSPLNSPHHHLGE